MTFPVTFGVGAFRLSAHFVFETAGFMIGFRYFLFLRKRSSDAISDTNRVWILIGAIFGALIGSRLLGALEEPARFFDPTTNWLYYYTQKTIVGGLLGGLIGVELIKKYIGERSSSGDLFTPPLILAMMIGRVGCFCNGIYEATYGVPSSLPWAMDLGDGILRHPVALYEIAFLGSLWLLLISIEKRLTFRNGIRFQLFMISYFLFRFLVEFIKPHIALPWVSLSSIQIACLLGLLYYLKTIYLLLVQPKSLQQA